MQPENKRLEEAAEWLRVAADDLRLADVALGLEPPITGLALYHAQQAAEKALKAYLVFRGHAYPFMHNLTELARPLAALDTTLLTVVEPGLDLSDFAPFADTRGNPSCRVSTKPDRGWMPHGQSTPLWRIVYGPGNRRRSPVAPKGGPTAGDRRQWPSPIMNASERRWNN
ncbi:MAG: HEPN domain-containing protein [Bryobacteraceae bacterium]